MPDALALPPPVAATFERLLHTPGVTEVTLMLGAPIELRAVRYGRPTWYPGGSVAEALDRAASALRTRPVLVGEDITP